jgi:hypothetical protein
MSAVGLGPVVGHRGSATRAPNRVDQTGGDADLTQGG